MNIDSPITEADRKLAEMFASSLEPRPAERSVDELTEADLEAIDESYAKAKADGSLQRACDELAMRRERDAHRYDPLYRRIWD